MSGWNGQFNARLQRIETEGKRIDEILDGQDIEPVNRLEYFFKKTTPSIDFYDMVYTNVSGLDTSALSQVLNVVEYPDINEIVKTFKAGRMAVIKLKPNAAGYSRYLFPVRFYVDGANPTLIFSSEFFRISSNIINFSNYFITYGKSGDFVGWFDLQYSRGTIPYTEAT